MADARPAPLKRIGRPRVDPDDQSVPVSLTLPARQYDQVFADAQRDRVSLAEAIRRRLAKSDDDRDDD